MNDHQEATTTEPPKRTRSWGTILLAVLPLLAAGWEVHVYLKAKAAEKNWPHVTGTVIENTAGKVHSDRGGVPVYQTYVSCAYQVDGSTYTASHIEVDKNSTHLSEQSAVEAVTAAYPKGGPVYVYYDPANPADSTLGEASTDGLMLPAVFFIAAVGLFRYA